MCLHWILVVSSYLACSCSCCAKVLFLIVSSGIIGKGYFGTILLVSAATAGLFLAALFLFTLPGWGRRLFVFRRHDTSEITQVLLFIFLCRCRIW